MSNQVVWNYLRGVFESASRMEASYVYGLFRPEIVALDI